MQRRRQNGLGATRLAALIRGLPLRQVDRVCPSRPAGASAVGTAAAADEGPPGEAEVALLDAVPAVLEAVLAGLDLVVDLLRDHLEGLLHVLARLGRGLGEADAVVGGKVARLLRRDFAVALEGERSPLLSLFCII